MTTDGENGPRPKRAAGSAQTYEPIHTVMNTETSRMLLHEELARARIRELREATHGQRELRRARAARRWNRVAHWAAKRSRHYAR
ncbi:hypothetical protein ACFS2C_13885 [Prauserella oleivorans]|uniref:Uncharacterized protein n=1 Tax=Prauserella oleivorans TaxID=1478153 RepID=A0ABW5W978_9PSEU